MPVTPEIYHLPGFYEPFSAISHLLAANFFLVLGYFLLRRGQGRWSRLVYLGIFVAATVTMFSLSGVYHMMVKGGTARKVMERLDHCAIFFLIAASFTPAHGILFRGWRRWAPLAFIWSASLTGITLKSIYFENLPEALGLSLYLGLGWFGAFSAVLLGQQFGFRFLKPLLWGGVAYSLGAVMEFFGWRIFLPGVIHPHEMFHLAVIVGAFCHWVFIWQFATGKIRVLTRANSN